MKQQSEKQNIHEQSQKEAGDTQINLDKGTTSIFKGQTDLGHEHKAPNHEDTTNDGILAPAYYTRELFPFMYRSAALADKSLVLYCQPTTPAV
jgi:hypothetical protein